MQQQGRGLTNAIEQGGCCGKGRGSKAQGRQHKDVGVHAEGARPAQGKEAALAGASWVNWGWGWGQGQGRGRDWGRGQDAGLGWGGGAGLGCRVRVQ